MSSSVTFGVGLIFQRSGAAKSTSMVLPSGSCSVACQDLAATNAALILFKSSDGLANAANGTKPKTTMRKPAACLTMTSSSEGVCDSHREDGSCQGTARYLRR